MFKDSKLNFEILDGAKWVMTAMMGLASSGQTVKDQQLAVRAYLDQLEKEEIDLKAYISDKIDSEKEFYVVEKEFWDQWSKPVTTDKFKPTIAVKSSIDNDRLIIPGHQCRMKEELVYCEHFVIVPKYVWVPLSKWYTSTK